MYCIDRNVKGPGCDDLNTQVTSPPWDTDDDMPKAKHAKVPIPTTTALFIYVPIALTLIHLFFTASFLSDGNSK